MLNHLANDIGTVLSVNGNDGVRIHEIAQLLVKAHKDVNGILHNQEILDQAGAVKWIEHVLAAEIPEIMPENLKFEPTATPFRLWSVIDVIVVLVILAAILVPIGIIVYFVRRKK